MSLTTLFLDMDAYFATVEQQENPKLRHKPVVVAPVVADAGCCIAVSYEAKRYRIKTGTRVGEARQQCPSLQVVEARPEVYVRFHHAMVAMVETYLHVEAVHSVDELSCRLMGVEREPQQAMAIARRIKQGLRAQVGDYLRCSIGLAPNRVLAKVAASMQKPDGLVAITKEELPERLYALELGALPGVGPRMLERLGHQGIRTMRQFCALSERDLRDIWHSVMGGYWWYWLRGDDPPDVPTHRRTVGHSHVLPPELRNCADARAILVRLLHRAAARLRNIRYWSQRLTVYVVFMPLKMWQEQGRLGLCQDTLTMLEVFARLWERCPAGRPLKVGIVLDSLVADNSATRPLFLGECNRLELARTMDSLNGRYGAHTIYFGGMHGVRDRAPRRIAFTNVPRWDPTEL
ncbi:MAG: DNA polymerase [bacterium]|nr:DNA polymerase [bacterium]